MTVSAQLQEAALLATQSIRQPRAQPNAPPHTHINIIFLRYNQKPTQIHTVNYTRNGQLQSAISTVPCTEQSAWRQPAWKRAWQSSRISTAARKLEMPGMPGFEAPFQATAAVDTTIRVRIEMSWLQPLPAAPPPPPSATERP